MGLVLVIGLFASLIIFTINEIIEIEYKSTKNNKEEKSLWGKPNPQTDSLPRYEGILGKYEGDYPAYYIKVDRNKFPDILKDKIPCNQSYNDCLEWDKKGMEGTKVRFYLDWEYTGCGSFQYPVIETFYKN